ncbi:MAG: helix-turn-helix domain-containing protein [Acidimicrobiales bacterium]
MTQYNHTQHDSDRRPRPAQVFVVRSDDDHLPEAAAQHVESPPASPTASDRLVLTVDEAAYLLTISRGLAYELLARGELPAIRLERRIVIPRVAMEELLGTPIRCTS